ncbi:MAG TPA: AMP-binding protein, partial [Thermoanaerobaculia bacterium]|nr:AMP-binding protein [Thermoanaerobaculia bacterium]
MDSSPASQSHATLVEVLQARASREPDALVYTFLEEGETEGASWTTSEIDRRAREVGARLQSRFAPGDRA